MSAAQSEVVIGELRARSAAVVRIAPLVTAFSAGAALTLAFAPLSWWPLAIVCPAVLIYLWNRASPRNAAWRGFWFNFGTFTFGTWWIYLGVHLNGGAPAWLALLLVFALSSIMSVYHAALGYLVARFFSRGRLLRWMIVVPAAWLAIEWLRGWFLSGYSWMSLGYSQTDTWLGRFAPVLGVYGISALLLISAGALAALARGRGRERLIALAVLALPWVAAALLGQREWTHPSGAPVRVAIVQGAVSQDEKWLEANRDKTLALYRRLTESVLGAPLIVWPEAAPPDLANNLVDYLGDLYREAALKGSSLALGIVRTTDDETSYYNSILAMSDGKVSWYSKNHLVPFAEFFPVPAFVRSWMRIMSLPYSDFERGAAVQPPLAAGGLKLSASICYEDGYGSAQLPVLKQGADALLNVTNDAWFGHSSARYQHFQIARMRAMEAQRFMIRAANDGVSGIIGPHGEVRAHATEYRPAVVQGTVTPRQGLPPYALYGNWLIIGLALGTLVATTLWNLRVSSGSIALQS